MMQTTTRTRNYLHKNQKDDVKDSNIHSCNHHHRTAKPVRLFAIKSHQELVRRRMHRSEILRNFDQP